MLTSKVISATALLTCWMILSGCSGLYGQLNGSNEVTRMFAQENLPGDYTYYYSGRSNAPYAVIGLKPGYEQKSKIWSRVEFGSNQFYRMIRNIWEETGSFNTLFQPQGAYIMSATGEAVGIWYSYFAFTTIEDKGNGQLVIYSPYIPSRWN